MEIYKQEEIKRVEFWLSREEKEDVELQKELEICYKSLAEAKYDVITFISGGAPLVDFRLQDPTFLQQNLRYLKKAKETPNIISVS